MPALDQAALLLQYGNLWVGDDSGSVVDLGAVRNVRFSTETARQKINSDNRGTILNKARPMGVVEFDWLEPGDLNKVLELFKGLVTRSTVAGTPVSNYSQVKASGAWAYNTFIPFDFQDADGTAPSIDSVTGGSNGALTVNVDYIVVQHDDGRWGIMVIDSSTVTTLSQTITIQFDYTPAASQSLSMGTGQTQTNRYLKIEAPDEDDSTKKRVIILAECVVTSEIIWQFLNVEDAGDVGVMPVRAESNKASTVTMTDPINPS